jgi:hypothetical protein
MAVQRRENWKYVGSSALTGGEFLKWSAAGQCDLATAVTDKLVGVAAEACGAGNVTAQNISVILPGQTVQVIASAAISAGAYVMPTTGGKAVTASGKSGTGNTTVSWYAGYALEAAGANLDVIEIMFWPTEVNV